VRRGRSVVAFAVALTVAAAPLGPEATARRVRRPVLHDCGDPFTGHAPAGFTVELSLDKQRYARGEPVTFTIRVTNGSGERFTHWVGLPEAVFAVFKNDKLIWSSSWAQAFPAIAIEETFEPGETKSATATWRQDLCRTDGQGGVGEPAFAPGPPGAGTYTAQATWRGMWASNVVSFRIGRR
jgi:hypothetical protein